MNLRAVEAEVTAAYNGTELETEYWLDQLRGVIAALRDARGALGDALTALDTLMGDTDLEGDDSPEFRAMQRGHAVLSAVVDP